MKKNLADASNTVIKWDSGISAAMSSTIYGVLLGNLQKRPDYDELT